jgi:hypothetical protein
VIRVVIGLLAAALLPAAGAYKTFSGGGVSFRYPAGWQVQRESVQGLHFRPIVELGTDALHARCVQSTDGMSCGWPLERLSPGGMVAIVSASTHPPIRGKARTPMKAEVLTSRPGACAEIGGDLTFDATIAVSRGQSDQIVVCAKSPGLERSRHVAMRLLRSLKIG